MLIFFHLGMARIEETMQFPVAPNPLTKGPVLILFKG